MSDLIATINSTNTNTTYGVLLTGYTVTGCPSPKKTGLDVPALDGLYYVEGGVSASTMTLHVAFCESTMSVLEQRVLTFISWLQGLGQMNITFSDYTSIQRKGYFNSASEYTPIRGINNCLVYFDILIDLFDPYVYNITNTSQTFYTVTSGATMSITNAGAKTPFIIQLWSSSSITSVTIEINGVEMKYDHSMAANDILKIDTGEMTVENLTQSLNGLIYFEGDMPMLVNGLNTIKVTTGNSVSCNYTFAYYKRWL